MKATDSKYANTAKMRVNKKRMFIILTPGINPIEVISS